MFHRIVIVVAAAVLLCGCSGGEGAPEGGAAERTASMQAGESELPEDGGADPDALVEEAAAEVPGDDAEEHGTGSDDVSMEEAVDEVPEETADEPPADPEPVNTQEATPDDGRASHLRVVRAYVCKGIEQSEPTEAGKSFVPEDGVLRLCCFSEVAGASGPDIVYHIWRWGDREMARVELEVKSSRWRTWSTKRILDEWQGEWRVDVTDADGVVLSSLEFSVE